MAKLCPPFRADIFELSGVPYEAYVSKYYRGFRLIRRPPDRSGGEYCTFVPTGISLSVHYEAMSHSGNMVTSSFYAYSESFPPLI
jgi:hypothetical protein